MQISGYAGGTTDVNQRSADRLGLDGGAFGTPVFLGEGDVKWLHKAFSAKALGTFIAIPDAGSLDAAYGKNIPTQLYGYYAEAAYDVLYQRRQQQHRPAQLIAFARYEYLNLAATIPTQLRGIDDPTLRQSHLIAGFNYIPIPNIAIKANVRLMHTGEQNPDLVINPAASALPYRQDNTFLNISVGYSF